MCQKSSKAKSSADKIIYIYIYNRFGPLQGVSISYSNGNPEECKPKNFRDIAGSLKIRLLPECGDITISVTTLSTPIVNCQYTGPQKSVVIESKPGSLFACIIQQL